MEYVSKGNLEEEDLRDEKNGELYVLDNNDDIYSSEVKRNVFDEENLFEVRNNGFIKNSLFNTDKEINYNEVSSELEKLKSANKINKIRDNTDEGITPENKEYSDLFFWNDNNKISPSNLEFLNDL